MRIVPLYYAVLFLAFVVVPQFHHPKLEKWGHVHGLGQVWYWLFLSNWSIALGGVGFRHGMVDLSWSLSIEEQFYLTWPLVVRSFSRRRLQDLCLGLVAVSLAVRLGLVLSGATPIAGGAADPGADGRAGAGGLGRRWRPRGGDGFATAGAARPGGSGPSRGRWLLALVLSPVDVRTGPASDSCRWFTRRRWPWRSRRC